MFSYTLDVFFHELELSLLDPLIRQSRSQLDRLIDDEFVEFGSSGKIYIKQDILRYLLLEQPRTFFISDFEIKVLAENVVFATYKTHENEVICLRSSIWKYHESMWRLVFHQGTKES